MRGALSSCLPAVAAAALGGACDYAGAEAYVPPDGGEVADAPDAPPDTPPGTGCLPYWHAGTVELRTPTRLAALGSDRVDRDPYPSRDERTLYFSTERGGALSGDVYAATRASLADPFDPPARRADLSSASYDSRVTMMDGELVAIVSSDRPVTEGGIDLWFATRAGRDQAFGPLTRMNLDNVNTSGSELDPELSADGLTLYLAVGAPQRIVRSKRGNVNGSFSSTAPIDELFSNTADADPAVSADERIILFTSTRVDVTAGGDARGDLWFARRPDAASAFSAPVRIPAVNSAGGDGDPALSADGCRLYFASDRTGDWELYVAEVQRP